MLATVSLGHALPRREREREGGLGIQLRQEDLVLPETTGGLHNKLITQDYLLLIIFVFSSLISFSDKKCPNMSVNKERAHAKTHTVRELDLNPAQCLFKLNDPC